MNHTTTYLNIVGTKPVTDRLAILRTYILFPVAKVRDTLAILAEIR